LLNKAYVCVLLGNSGQKGSRRPTTQHPCAEPAQVWS